MKISLFVIVFAISASAFKLNEVITLRSATKSITVKVMSEPNVAGSTAMVFQVKQIIPPFHNILALKYYDSSLYPDKVDDIHQKDNTPLFHNEVQILDHLKELVLSGQHNDKKFILMKFHEGSTITTLMNEKKLTTTDELDACYSAARIAMIKLHDKGVYHNDMFNAVDNILFTDSKPPVAHIIDFGQGSFEGNAVKELNTLRERIKDNFKIRRQLQNSNASGSSAEKKEKAIKFRSMGRKLFDDEASGSGSIELPGKSTFDMNELLNTLPKAAPKPSSVQRKLFKKRFYKK